MFPAFLVLKMKIPNYESGRNGQAASCRENLRNINENRKDVVNQVNILCLVQVEENTVLKFDIPVPTNLNVSGSMVFVQ